MAAARTVFYELGARRSGVLASKEALPVPKLKLRTEQQSPAGVKTKILLQPRICTLRSYGSGEREVVMRTRDEVRESPFFSSLVEYVESSRRSHDFETVSGRLAMIVFASAVSVEMVTGNSIFKKMDLQQIAGAGGVCFAVVVTAAAFAQLSSARTKIGQMFTLGCNSFVDSLIDDIVDSLFYEIERSDWSDEV